MLFRSIKELKQVVYSAFPYFLRSIMYALIENWLDLYFVFWSRFRFGSIPLMVLNSLPYNVGQFSFFSGMYLHGDACILPTALTNLHFPPLLFSLREHLVEHIFTQKCSLTILKLFFLCGKWKQYYMISVSHKRQRVNYRYRLYSNLCSSLSDIWTKKA